MPSHAGRQSGCRTRLVLAILLAGAAVLAGAFITVNANPRLAAKALGLDHLGPLTDALPPEAAPRSPDGAPLEAIDLVAPPLISQPLSLTTEEAVPAGAVTDPLMGDATSPGKTTYHLTISEAGLNELIRHHHQDADAADGRSQWVDLHPGGMALYKNLDLGLAEHRVGLLLVQEGTPLTVKPGGVLLGEELYAMPKSGSLAALLIPTGRRVQRVLNALTVTGPLPGQASASAIHLHGDHLVIEAEATYALSSLADTGWRTLEAGLDLREIEVPASAERGGERLRMVRLAPSMFDVRIQYDPANPKTISGWAAESGALLTVNGSYFSPETERGLETIGLLVSDGQRWGTPLQDFAGMLAVRHDGQTSVRWLRHRPFDPTEPLAQALQSFPVLVKPGGMMGFPEDADDGTPARRTVVGQDSGGNLWFVIAPRGTMSLHELAVLLAEPGLGLDVALNLDGGQSSGMWLEGTEWDVTIDSVASVPSSVVIHRR